MEEILLCAPEHQAVFRRVWERVMAGHPDTGCPVEVTGDLSCQQVEQQVQTGQSKPFPCPDRRGGDLPTPGTEPGRADECTARLRQQVWEALEGWQLYRHLARRTRNPAARKLADLANHQHRQARKLAAAYFLLTGLRYWPTDRLSTPVIPSLWGTLRRRHQEESQAEVAYRMGAEEAEDAALRDLYLELAEGCRERQRQLRGLLEQSCT